MKTLKSCSTHKGFSLIELLIVIVIVSGVYFLGFEEFKLGEPKPKPLTPMNLKTQIVNSPLHKGRTTLMCLDKCSSCYLRSGLSSSFQTYGNDIDLQGLKAYTIDQDDSLVSVEYGRYDDKEICLIMDFYRNGSATQIILQDKEGTYFLPSFFETPLHFDSPQEAKAYWVNKSYRLSDSGAFY
jgi:prepilin-type N-terminal cleavage/methylation domain-containing protein